MSVANKPEGWSATSDLVSIAKLADADQGNKKAAKPANKRLIIRLVMVCKLFSENQ